MKVSPIIVAILFTAIGVSDAHDCWLSPDRFVLDPGDTLVVRQRFGHELETELELALDKDLTTRFELISADGEIDLIEEAPERIHPRFSPLLKRPIDFTGLGLLVMDHGFETTELPGDVFSRYVEHEELRAIRALLEQRSGSAADAPEEVSSTRRERERYARATKSLIRVGRHASGDLHKRVVGQTLEILLLQNPYQLDPGDSLEVQVLYEGEPLVDELVWAQRGDRNGLVSRAKGRTDADGVVRFRIDGGGFWLVRMIHMEPCSSCPDADWQSYWASFSFEVD